MSNLIYTNLLRESIDKHESRDCFHIKRNGQYTSWTYSEFRRDLNALTSALKSLGLHRGDNAIIIGDNSPEWVIAWHAIALTGACVVPVDPGFTSDEIRSIAKETKAKLVFCSRQFVPLFLSIQHKQTTISMIITFEKTALQKCCSFSEFLAWGDSTADAFSEPFSPEDPISIIFTSGTTGKSKGVVLAQRNLVAAPLHAVPRMNVTHKDTMIAFLPLHHVFGFAACIAASLPNGMDIVFVPGIKGPKILEALQEKKVSILPSVPKMLTFLYDKIEHEARNKGKRSWKHFSNALTLSQKAGGLMSAHIRRLLFGTVHKKFGGKLRLIISGGASLSEKYFNGFRNLGFEIVEGFGLSETFGPITLCPTTKPRLGSVGPILPGNEIKIDTPDNNGTGEVLLRGTCVFSGYYNNPQKTKEAFDTEGWFRTGDLGCLDKDGYLTISGRLKDMIVLESGKKVFPDELEDYYAGSPAIDEICVFGIKENNNEIVAAVAVPDLGVIAQHSHEDVEKIVREEIRRLGHIQPVYRRIKELKIAFTPLPRTSSRKLKRHEVRALFMNIPFSAQKPAFSTGVSFTEISLKEKSKVATAA